MLSYTDKVIADFSKMMKRFTLPEKPFGILLGLSGGADSSALFSLLYDNREKYGYTLYALHVNHMIRGAEADRDEAFCRELCQRHGVDFTLIKYDVPSLANQRGKGLEEAARDLRYESFAKRADEIKKSANIDVLTATAHNADDNVETVLFNMTRGTSLNGLCGIKPIRGSIIRPILLSTKDEIIGYCEENGIEYICDSTNNTTEYTRNKIRHLILPTLRDINPSISSAVARMCETLTLDNDYMSKIASAFLKDYSKRLPLDELNSLDDAIKGRVIRMFLEENGAYELSDTNISDVSKLCMARRTNSKITLPGGISALIERGQLTVVKTVRGHDALSFSLPLEYGVTVIPETGASVARFKAFDTENIIKFQNIYKIFIQTRISSAKIEGNVYVRQRQPGDKVTINGVSRKLKKLLWEIEPCAEKRDILPVFCDDNGIIWVPGARSRSGSFPKSGEDYEIFMYSENNDNK